jgi:hypothetical protein
MARSILLALLVLLDSFVAIESSVVVVGSMEAFSDAIAAQAPGTDAFYSFDSLKAKCSNYTICETKLPIIIDQQKGVFLAPQGNGQLVLFLGQATYTVGFTGLFHVFDNATLQLTRVTLDGISGGGNGRMANIVACNATVLLNDTIISHAYSFEGTGGGLFGFNIKLRAYNTSWQDNEAMNGGAIATWSSDVGIYDSNFSGNIASQASGGLGNGGAVSFRVGDQYQGSFCPLQGGYVSYGSRPNRTIVRSTVFADNCACGAESGGAAYLDVATNQDGAAVFAGCAFTGNQASSYLNTVIDPWGFSMGGAVSVASLGCAADKGQWFTWENCTCGGNTPYDFADSVSACGLRTGQPNYTWPVGFICKTPFPDWVQRMLHGPAINATSDAGPCSYWCNEQ